MRGASVFPLDPVQPRRFIKLAGSKQYAKARESEAATSI